MKTIEFKVFELINIIILISFITVITECIPMANALRFSAFNKICVISCKQKS